MNMHTTRSASSKYEGLTALAGVWLEIITALLARVTREGLYVFT